MPYITSVERLGRQEGRQEGLAEGLLEGKRAALRRLVARRFGVLPEALAQRIGAMDEAALDALLDRVLVVASVDDL